MLKLHSKQFDHMKISKVKPYLFVEKMKYFKNERKLTNITKTKIMKKQQLKSKLQLQKATIINFENRTQIKGGFETPTGESCFEVCETRDNLKCSWGAE
jgi:hypothetical protein